MNKYNVFFLSITLLFLSGATSAEEGDAVRGEIIFKQCSFCHTLGKETDNRIGPDLKDIVGSKVASKTDFDYSESFKLAASKGLIWNEANINQFIKRPENFIPKSKMIFLGLSEDIDRLDIIAYLKGFNSEDVIQDPASIFSVSKEILAIEGDREYGEYLASECTTCHQKDKSNDGIPNIFGMNTKAFVISMHAYKQKFKDNQVMQLVAGRLTNDEIASLEEYFKSLK